MKFEAGKTYFTRSIVDADTIIKVVVVSRTAKTITTDEGKKLRISEWEGVEQVRPWGSYSMCPIVSADREFKAEPVKAEQPETLAELMAEGEKLFTPEQFEEIKTILRETLAPLAESKPSAKVYNMADYRKKA